jgi:hypothetical protein
MRRYLPAWFVLFSISAPLGSAADVIGFVYSGGSYRMDGVGVRGNATLFEGSTVEIGEAAAKVQLAGGAGIWLAPKSRATMSTRGVRLLAGMGQFDAPPDYLLEARAVRVASAQPHTTVRLALDETGGTVVVPLTGMVRVTNSRGVRVGELVQGGAVRFAGQAETPSRVSVSGCLYASGDRFGLTDAVTNVPVRLTGRGLQQEIGHVVDVSGVEAVAASEGLNVAVTSLRRLTAGTCVSGSSGPAGLLAMARPAEITEQIQSVGPRLNLLVLEGEGAINNIKQRTAREPVVEVQDENHRPVAGALVLFALPRGGASGSFANGATTLRVTTDAQGRAAARGLKPNNVAGQVEIVVSASFAGLTASIVVHQINTPAGVSGTESSTGGNSATTPRNVGQSAGTQSSRTGSTNSGAGGTTTGGGAAGTGTGAGAGTGTGGGAAGTGGAGGTGAGSGAGTGTGMGIGSKVAIIGGITATAVAGGLAAAGVFGGGAEPAVSR